MRHFGLEDSSMMYSAYRSLAASGGIKLHYFLTLFCLYRIFPLITLNSYAVTTQSALV
jgi:hypothetical protein